VKSPAALEVEPRTVGLLQLDGYEREDLEIINLLVHS
jgi:hypothetical protein